MAEKLATAPAQKLANEVEADDPDEEGPRPGARPTAKHADAFGAAFDAAEKQLTPKAVKAEAGDDDDEEPAPKAKAPKAKAADETEEDKADAKQLKAKKPADKQAQKDPEQQPAKKAKAATVEDDDDDAGDEELDEDDEAAAKAARIAAKKAKAEADKPKGPLQAKNYWPRERREAFPYQSREVQQQWLDEAPTPHAHWATEQKETFAKQPREVQEAWLDHTQAVERGFGQKFEALAGEKKKFDGELKLVEGIRGAVTPEIRQQMQQFGLKDESEVFKGLLHLQQLSVRDPIKYVRDFIVRNKLDPSHFIPTEEGDWPTDGRSAQPQADISSHPVVQSLMAEVKELKQRYVGDVEQREKQQADQIDAEMASILAKRDESGQPRFPYIRVLGDDMARIIEGDSARFEAMGREESLAEAYALALKLYPELPQSQQTASKKAAESTAEERDEDDADDADSDDDEATVKLQQATTKKSKTPLSAPGKKSGDPFGRAFSKAEKQLGHRH